MSRLEELTTQTRELLAQVRDLTERSQTVTANLKKVLAALEELRQTPDPIPAAAVPAAVGRRSVPKPKSKPPQVFTDDEADAGDLADFDAPTPEEALAAFGVIPTELVRPKRLADDGDSGWEPRKPEARKEPTPRKPRSSPSTPAVEKPTVRRPAPTHQGATRTASEIPTRERRQSARRAGNIVSVQIRRGTGDMLSGWILDRSVGGLALLMDEEIAVDTALFVRPTSASEDTPWIKAEARYSVSMGGSYRMGCKFVNNPTWQQLRVFG